MLKFCFVILHYQNIDDTINCINSIKNLNTEDEVKIIILDNKSPNNTGLILKEKYASDKSIDVLLMDKNYGFSYTNNVGYKKALSYGSDLVLVSNNDILIEDNKFLIKLKELYNSNKKYDIICPDIINCDNNHQNPLSENEFSIGRAYKNIIYELLYYVVMFIPYLRNIAIKRRNLKEKKWMENYYANKNYDFNKHFVPFGAFIIYANNWLKKENIAFVSDTFMYAEEDMLSLYIKKKNYNICYDENLVVRHLEGRSTDKSTKNQYNKFKFKSINKIKALFKYIKFYRKINR